MDWKFTGNRPIFKQVEDFIKRDIRSGVLPTGTDLPVYRVLAANLALSPTAVARAFSNLAEEGVLQDTGEGIFRVIALPNAENVEEVIDPEAVMLTAEYCNAMLMHDIPRKMIIELVCDELVKYNKKSASQAEDNV